MVINTDKTKSVVSSKEPTRCKLEIEQKIVEQVNQFKYLGAEITSYGNLQNGVREQTMKAFRVSGCLRDIVWKNKYLNISSKIRESTIRPVITYAAETRPDTSKTLQMMRMVEMKIIRSIHGKTLHDRIRSEDLRQRMRKYWNKHVNRMEVNRLVKISKTNNPVGKRTQGRPPKRWKECWTSTSEEA